MSDSQFCCGPQCFHQNETFTLIPFRCKYKTITINHINHIQLKSIDTASNSWQSAQSTNRQAQPENQLTSSTEGRLPNHLFASAWTWQQGQFCKYNFTMICVVAIKEYTMDLYNLTMICVKAINEYYGLVCGYVGGLVIMKHVGTMIEFMWIF